MCNHLERFKNDVREGMNVRAMRDGVPPIPAWQGDPHAFFPIWLQLLGQIEHVATFWDHRKDANVLLVHYNDLKADLAGEMRRIAKFLDITVPEAEWPAVIERCTFESMQANGEWLGEIERLFDGGTKSFIFKGTNGRWRDVLTPDERELYAARVAELLPPAAATWMESGRRAVDPRSS
jgi:aryl sulfotransferase